MTCTLFSCQRSGKIFHQSFRPLHQFSSSKIVSGGAKGADTLAENYAREYQIDTLIFKPDYKKYGRVAPIIRNATIIDNANIVVAFWNGKSKGTKNAIDNAKRKMKVVKIDSQH
ncbi:MAG: DUF2493 domain-containing protein [Chlorobium sp.]|nr:DUF2493 domain-containing protein [Chlorobium sp.]